MECVSNLYLHSSFVKEVNRAAVSCPPFAGYIVESGQCQFLGRTSLEFTQNTAWISMSTDDSVDMIGSYMNGQQVPLLLVSE